MAHMIAGLFEDSTKAGDAVSKLLQMDEVEDVSVIAKDPENGELKSHQVKQDTTDGALVGATAGGALGGLLGLLAGVSSVAVPGVGPLLIAGPLAAAWGVTGGAIGSLGGGLVGALVDAGIPEKRALMYQERILAGEVLVTATTPHAEEEKVRKVMAKHQVEEINTIHADVA